MCDINAIDPNHTHRPLVHFANLTLIPLNISFPVHQSTQYYLLGICGTNQWERRRCCSNGRTQYRRRAEEVVEVRLEVKTHWSYKEGKYIYIYIIYIYIYIYSIYIYKDILNIYI